MHYREYVVIKGYWQAYPKDTQHDLQISAWHVPQVSHGRSKAEDADCRIEPWEARQFDIDQCRTLTLVTAVEVLQNLAERSSSESKPSAACSCPAPVTAYGMALHRPSVLLGQSVCVCKTPSPSDFMPPMSCKPCICCLFVKNSCLSDGLPCAKAGGPAAAFLRVRSQQLRDALTSALTVLPPGAEDLALHALSCLLHPALLRSVRGAAEEALQRFCASGSTLCEAALRQGAWRQEVLSLHPYAGIALLQPSQDQASCFAGLCHPHSQLCKMRSGCLPCGAQPGRMHTGQALQGCHALCKHLLHPWTHSPGWPGHIW